MNPTVKQIVAMLDAPDMELRLAAVRVLSELGVKEAALARKLAEMAGAGNAVLRTYALDAIGRLGSDEALPAVLDALREPGEVRTHAIDALKAFGAAAVPHLKTLAKTADADGRRQLVGVLASIGTAGAMDALLEFLQDPDFDIVRDVCNTVRGKVDRACPSLSGPGWLTASRSSWPARPLRRARVW